MNRSMTGLFAPLFALVLAVGLIGGCDSSDGGGYNPEIEGQVLAPMQEAPMLAAASDYLEAVPGATVELIEVDVLGEQVGEVLATATTSTTGDYRLTLPAGISFGANLVVRVSGTTADGLRGQVVRQMVDVSPISEYVLRKLTSDGNTLANVSINEVLSLSGHIEEFDFGVTPDIEQTISNLNDVVAPTLDPLVELSQKDEADAASLTGDYHWADFVVTQPTGNGVHLSVEQGEASLIDNGDGSGNGSAVDGAGSYFDVSQNAFGPNQAGGFDYSLFVQTGIDNPEPGAEGVPFQFSTDGSITILEPIEEELFGEGEPGYPGGDRSPMTATTHRPMETASTNPMYAAATHFVTNTYGLTEDNSMLDLSNQTNAMIEFGFHFFAKQQALVNSSLDDKTFGFIGFGYTSTLNGFREIYGDVGTVSFASSDMTTGNMTVNLDTLSLERTPSGDSSAAGVSWMVDNLGGGGADDVVPLVEEEEVVPYTIDAGTGAITVAPGVDGEAHGFFGSHGDVLVIQDNEADDGDPVTYGEVGMTVGVRLGTTNPTVDGKDYRALYVIQDWRSSGFHGLIRSMDVTLSISGSDVTLSGTDSAADKNNDGDGAVSFEVEDLADSGTLSFTGSNGACSVSLTEGGTLSGFFNHDGSVCVLRYHSSALTTQDDEASMGMIILIEK